MSTALTTTKGNVVAEYTAQSNPFLAAAAGVGEYFGKRLSINGNTGEIHIGPKDDEEYLEKDTELVLDLFNAEHGHICWVEEEVAEELMEPIALGRKLPNINDLPDHGPYEKHDDGSEDGWSVQFRFKAYDEKTGEPYTFSTMSKSGVRAVRKLMKEYGSKFPLKIGKDGQYMVPVVVFGVTSFKIKDKPKLGKKYSPDFEIVDWIEASEAAVYFQTGENPDDYDGEEDAKETSGRRSSRDADSDKPKEETRGRRSSRAADSGKPKEETRGRRSTRAADSGEKEEEETRGRRSGRTARDADSDKPKEEETRGRRSSRDADSGEAKEETSSRRSSRDADSGEKKEESGGRRTTVRHADPQDGDDDVDANVDSGSRRESARGRRGRRG